MGPQLRSLLYEKQFRLEVSPDRVFAALSEAEEQSRWFAEHSHALPRLHGSNAFWGKHTLWAKTIKFAKQYFSIFEPPRRLGYQWELKDHPTEVIFELGGVGGATRVSMRHELIEGEVDHRFANMVSDFWRIALLNLLWHLEKGAPMFRLDYSDCKGDVALRMDLTAPPAQTFQALTLPAKMDAWLSRQARVELRVGGRYDFGWTEDQEGKSVPAGPTVLSELVADQKIAYVWSWPGEGKKTKVSWELKQIKGGTRVSLNHTGFDPKRDSTDYKQGWGAFLCMLKLYLERGVKWE